MPQILKVFLVGLLLLSSTFAFAAEIDFDSFLSRFDYEVREDMKIDSKGVLALVPSGKAVLIDVRFPDEVAAWRTGFAINIPLNELPKRLSELPKDKIIIAACPHKDRSAIAMAYLRTKGYDAKYLTDGLIGLAEQLRGEKAKDFMDALEKQKKNLNSKGRGTE